MGKEQVPAPLFSAKEALFPWLNEWRAWRTELVPGEQLLLPDILSELALLLPEHTQAEQAELRKIGTEVETKQLFSGKMMHWLMYADPELLEPVMKKLYQKYPRDELAAMYRSSLRNPERGPTPWMVVMNRVLYPDTPDLDIEDSSRNQLVEIIISWSNGQLFDSLREAALVVLLDPGLKPRLRPHFLKHLENFRDDYHDPKSSDAIRRAFALDVLFGDTFEGLDSQGKMMYMKKPLGTANALPERQLT